jgi:hypothetical protein
MGLTPKSVLEELGMEPDAPERVPPSTTSSSAKKEVADFARRQGIPVSKDFARSRNKPHHDFGFERLRIWDRVVVAKTRFQARQHYREIKANAAVDKVPGKINIAALLYKRGKDGWLVVTSLEEFLKIAKLADSALVAIAEMSQGETE